MPGWRIDIKSATAAEAEAVAEVALTEAQSEVEEAAAVAEPPPAEALVEELPVVKPELVSIEEEEEAAPAVVAAEEETPPPVPFEVPVAAESTEIRFAEDIMARGGVGKVSAKPKKKKKGTRSRDDSEAGAKPKNLRRAVEIYDEEEEGY